MSAGTSALFIVLTTSAGTLVVPAMHVPPTATAPVVAQAPMPLPSDPDAPRTVKASASPLRIDSIRIEPAAHSNQTGQSSLLTCDMFNESTARLRDPVLEISIVENRNAEDTIALPRTLAGPYLIKTNVILNAGFSISYEIVLRNLPPDCHCVPKVDLQSVRVLPE
jgi:hypothetical protein